MSFFAFSLPLVIWVDRGKGAGKVEQMRKDWFSLTFALLALTAGCRSGPTNASNPAAGANGATAVAQSQKTKQDLAIESIKRRGGAVQVDFEDLQKAVAVADLHGFFNAGSALDSLAPLTKLREVNLHATGFTDADLERFRGSTSLQSLNLSGTKITDAGLAVLQTLPNLHTLNLNETRITNAGLQYLRGMENLSDLSLYGTKVTDEGLTQLQGMAKLQKLVLGGSSSITDRGLIPLRSMPQLRDLVVLSSRVTNSEIEDLKIASPQLKIVH